MTEEEWLQSRDPRPMLSYLERSGSGRKLRLLAYAVYSRVSHFYERLWDSEKTIAFAEHFADGQAIVAQTRGKLESANVAIPKRPLDAVRLCCSEAQDIAYNSVRAEDDKVEDKWSLAFKKVNISSKFISIEAYSIADSVVSQKWMDRARTAYRRETAAQADLVREIFGNPARRVKLNPRWIDSNVAEIARTAYDERKFYLLPILADALEDAGCDSADILDHLRGDAPHVRGCWALDLILGKK